MMKMKEPVQRLILTPPTEADCYGEKPWLIGMWLCPATKLEWVQSQFNVIPYHWENRSKLEADVESIKVYIGNLKKLLYPTLNQVHQTDHSYSYWNVLLGEWVYLYTQILFDRWSIVNSVFFLNKSNDLLRHPFQVNPIPYDTHDFMQSAITDHDWNANLFIDLAYQKTDRHQGNSEKVRIYAKARGQSAKSLSQKLRLWNFLSRMYISIFPKSKEVIVQSPYLSNLNFIRLCHRLRGLMYFKSGTEFAPSEDYSRLLRESLSKKMMDFNEGDLFSKVLINRIADYLPTIYLEHYNAHKEFARKKYFNISPRLIVTANSHYTDETWKSWAASAKEKGAKLIILQHGGHYGHSRFSLIQDYEIDLADIFLSWGWTNPIQEKIRIAPANKLIGIRLKRKNKNICLVVTTESSTYAHWVASMPIGPQIMNSKEMTIGFLKAVKNSLLCSVRVRTYPVDYGLDQKKSLKSLFPQLSISSDDCDFRSDLKDARIVVFNHFSTTFIEAIKMKIPSVVFINPVYWETEDAFARLFSSLEEIGVLHYSSESCAQFVEQIWDSVDDWWSNPLTVKIVDEFIELYGYTGCNPIKELSETILEISDKNCRQIIQVSSIVNFYKRIK